MDSLIIGGGVSGLATALGLARAGREVTVLDRDDFAAAADPDAAFAAPRRGVPHSHHSHVFRAKSREVLRHRAPDVLERLHAAGAADLRLCELLPATIEDRVPQLGDDELVALAARRTTFEWALREATRAQPGVTFRGATGVAGLLAEKRRDAISVVGVRTETGESLAAPMVVDASGRRSPLRSWLEDVGVHLPAAQVEDCGVVYFSRYYRLRHGRSEPDFRITDLGADLGDLIWGIILGDNGVFSVVLIVPSDDMDLRPIRHNEVFHSVALAIPGVARWIDPDRSEPISDVRPMAKLTSGRRYLVEDGQPLVLGVHAVGDALMHTNPADGWGCSLGLAHAFGLVDVVTSEPDPVAQALQLEDFVEREIDPFYLDSVEQDREYKASRSNGGNGNGEAGCDPDPMGLAAGRDATVARAVMRVDNLLALPDVLASDEIASRVARFEGGSPPEPAGPDRHDLLAAVVQAR